jgi:hypothetical protein
MIGMRRLDAPREADELGQLAPVDVVIALDDVVAERRAIGGDVRRLSIQGVELAADDGGVNAAPQRRFVERVSAAATEVDSVPAKHLAGAGKRGGDLAYRLGLGLRENRHLNVLLFGFTTRRTAGFRSLRAPRFDRLPLPGRSSESSPEGGGKSSLAKVDRASPDNPAASANDNAKAAAAQEERQPCQTGVLPLADLAAARNLTRPHQRLDIDGSNPETLGDCLRVHGGRSVLEADRRIRR